jgi:hypothetical protein
MTPERVAEIYDELGKLIVELDPDPVARGPAYLQDLIAKVRGYLNRVSIYVQEAHRERHDKERELDAKQAAFDVEADRLLSEDKRVARQPNIDDRKAMINLILGDERREIDGLKRELRSLGHVEKAIRHRQKELDNTMSAIRLQRSLIQAELRTGSFYGDETETSRGDAWGKKKAADEPDFDDELGDDELSQLLAEAERQLTTEAEADAAEPEPTPEPEPEEPKEPKPLLEQALELAEGAPSETTEEEDPDIEQFLAEDDDDFDGLFDELEPSSV